MKENFRHRAASGTAALIGLISVLVAAVTRKEIAGGFICGAVAFGFSAISLEQLTRRIIQKEHVLKGIRSGVFWLVFKFLAPAILIFVGLTQGFSPAAMVIGMVVGLFVFSIVLWLSRSKRF